ncbi:MAG: matrixin family metalloprotease [Alphaproteobacteria bacterium]
MDRSALQNIAPSTVSEAFQASGFRWRPGEAITWTVSGGGVDGRQTFDTVLDGDWLPVIQQAFDTWAATANLSFQFVATDAAGVDIRLGGIAELDGPGNVLALSMVSFLGDDIQFADIQFDLAEDFTLFGVSDSISVFATTLHELGHALGLNHEDRVDALLNANYDQDIQTLLPDDRAAIRAIYGAPGEPTPPVPANNDDGTLVATSAADSVSTGDSGVRVFGLGGADTIDGGAGDDTLAGSRGFDLLRGGPGDDLVRGQFGDDNVRGEEGDDTVIGGAGNDTLVGSNGADLLSGQSGNDTLLGEVGSDTLRGGGGGDSLFGGPEDDLLVGHAGDDTIIGGAGVDTLIGGPGNDSLIGGDPANFFVTTPGHGDDTVLGFEDGIDRISLVGIAGFDDVVVSQDGDHATVTADGLSLTLIRFPAADLSADDFIFS